MNAKILPAGESCLFVEFGDIVSRELNARVTALKAALEAAPLPGVTELVPTYRSLAVNFDPLTVDLAALKTSGARLAVATSLPPQLREPAMRHVGILDFFDEVVSVDDAGDVGKDRPDVYLLAASRLGVEPVDCTVFEDLLTGMRSAKSVGMHVWAMHDDSSDADWPEICELADGVMFDFHDAPVIL